MMDTDRLIGALAADGRQSVMPMRTTWWLALAAGAIASACVFGTLLGPRPDIGEAMRTLRFPFKFVVTLLTLATALRALTVLARPGMPVRQALVLLVAAPLVLAVAAALELWVLPADQIVARTVGTNNTFCLMMIPLIGIGPLAAFLVALRRGAPTRPALSGIVAGLASGGLAASFYALHCPDDSPLFLAVWYTLATAILACLGGLIGRWSGRW